MTPDSFQLLVIDDEAHIRTGLAKGLASDSVTVEMACDGSEAIEKFRARQHEVVVTDLRLKGLVTGLDVLQEIHETHPETSVIVITAYGSIETAVDAMRMGAYDFITKPIDLKLIRHQISKALEHRQLIVENRQLRERLADTGEDLDIIGSSAVTQELLRQLRQIADTDATVLIHGESGTGKELAARAIHRFSPRVSRPFVTVHLGALPETLLESELFGYEKGAFTGAHRQKIGQIEAAQGGTLFLDEITETSPKSQVDLLRVLEQREFRRLGGTEVIPADIRVIAASNADIDALVRDGTFREDLFYRLNVVPVHVPTLRERRQDIPILIAHFAEQLSARYQRPAKQFADRAIQTLCQHNWPGNIRQLRNVVERLVVTVGDDIIHDEDLPSDVRNEARNAGRTLQAAVEEVEKLTIADALRDCDNHRERTAKMLNVSLRTLQYKIKRYGLS
jgi:two-component system NtrC family response regulator